MRNFQLPSADPLFQQESLLLLADMQAAHEPSLVPELRDYLAAQAPFIVEVASGYRSHSANWPALLAAGQHAFVEIWQECHSKQEKLPIFIKSEVGEAMRAVAAEQLAGITTAENLASWAREAGESDAIATAFAEYHRTGSADYEQDMAEEVAKFGAQVPANDEEAAGILDDLAEVAKSTTAIPATVLSWAWAYLETYKAALAKGHSPEWANTYARQFGFTDDERNSEREAYDQMRGEHPDSVTDTYPTQGWVNNAVYQEAYGVCLDRGSDYADAYARTVGLGSYDAAEAYAEAFVQQRRAGKSELFADYYAGEVSNRSDPEYAALEAEIYEQALADGMIDGWAQEYAERLATNLIEYAATDEDKEFYIQEAAEYIAQQQNKSN